MSMRGKTCCRSAGRLAALSLLVFALSGCARSPSFNVLGSYFPGWIAFIFTGVLVTVLLRLVLNRTGLEQRLPALPLLYFAMALLVACVMWLIAFE